VADELPESREGYVRAFRTELLNLLRDNRNAHTLISAVAYNARWTDGPNRQGLKLGEAFIRGCGECGLTNAEYRSAKDFLKRHGYVTLKATNGGTVFRLTNTRLFSISKAADNYLAASQQLANNKRREKLTSKTTNGESLFESITTGDFEASEGRSNQRNNQRLSMEARKLEASLGRQSAAADPSLEADGERGPERHVISEPGDSGATGGLPPDSVREVLEFSLTRAGFKTFRVSSWLDGFDLNRPAGEMLVGLGDDTRAPFEVALRFVRYNNARSWQLEHSWRSAFDGFAKSLSTEHGAADVPPDWTPTIEFPVSETTTESNYENDCH
jgi:hypothetical protein